MGRKEKLDKKIQKVQLCMEGLLVPGLTITSPSLSKTYLCRTKMACIYKNKAVDVLQACASIESHCSACRGEVQ